MTSFPAAKNRNAIETPCRNVCVMRTDGFCEGCARTLDEIAGWGGYTPERRRAIMDRLPARLSARAPGES